MSVQNYAVIDASNNIINKIVYAVGDIPPNPHPCYPDHTIVAIAEHVGMQVDGWTYVNGEFVAPPSQELPIPSVLPSVLPSVIPAVLSSALPSIAELQAQMAQIQAHLSALVANGSSGETGVTGEVGPQQ